MENGLLDGKQLSITHLTSLLNSGIDLSAEIWDQVENNRKVLEDLLATSGERYYGINTGFGAMYSIPISDSDIAKLQINLLRSHACGVGPSAPVIIVKLTLLLKIISLSQGYSGIRSTVIQALLSLHNNHILPVVPTMGSLGASGDLAPLAHLCLVITGEGEVVYKREQMSAMRALQLAEIDPVVLESKEGLALINGTQYSLAWLIYALDNAQRMMDVIDMCSAMSMDAFDCHPSLLDNGIHHQRKQKGQIVSAASIKKWLAGSEIHNQAKQHLQDPYSFRCAPQVQGATRDVIEYAKGIADNEINAVTDNPLVFSGDDGTRIISGGNFHAQPVGLASDFMAIALSEFGSISERRSYLMLSGQRGLPQALAVHPGLESGMMICQYTAAAIAGRNKILSHPATVDSIVTSAGQEDHVSMAATAGIKLYEVVNNVWKIIAIEWMIACEGIESRRPLHTSPMLEEKHAAYRNVVPALTGDRSLSNEIDATENFLRQINFS